MVWRSGVAGRGLRRGRLANKLSKSSSSSNGFDAFTIPFPPSFERCSFVDIFGVWTCPKLQAEDGVVFKEGMELGGENGDHKGASGRA